MAGNLGTGYDIIAVLTETEITRAVQTSFLEGQAVTGLPREEVLMLPNNVIPGLSASTMFLRFGLPIVTVLPTRRRVFDIDLNAPEFIDRAIQISLPFSESALVLDDGQVVFANLSGSMMLNAQLIQMVQGLVPDLASGGVWLTFAEDDSDPLDGNRTSVRKLKDELNWSVAAHTVVESVLTQRFQAGQLPLPTGAIQFAIPGGACPTAASGLPPSTNPSLTVPGPRCVDFEIRAELGKPGAVVLKLKLGENSFNEGTANRIANLSWMQQNERIGVLVANRFLLQDVLPPGLMLGLLDWELGQEEDRITQEVRNDNFFSSVEMDEEIDRRLDERTTELIEEHFTRPLAIKKTIGIYVADLPFSHDESDGPNVFFPSVDTTVTTNSSGDTVLRISLGLNGFGHGYEFSGTIEVDIKVEARAGLLQLDITPIEQNLLESIFTPKIVVRLLPGSDLSIAVLAALLNPLLLGIPVISVLLLADWFTTAAASLFGPSAAVSQLNTPMGNAGDVARVFGQMGFPVLVKEAALDDLILHSQVVRQENNCVSYEGFTPASQSWQLDLDTPAANVQTGRAADAHISANGAVITVGNGTEVADLGDMPVWEALNVCQPDLRVANFGAGGEFQLPDLLMPLPYNAANLINTPDLPVRVLAVKTPAGAFAFVLLWRMGPRSQCFYRRYMQARPRVQLLVSTSQSSCRRVRSVEKTIYIPTGFSDLTGRFELRELSYEIPLDVGWTQHQCTTTGIALPLPTLLRRPLTYEWAVLTDYGRTFRLRPGRTRVININPPDLAPILVEFQLPATSGSCSFKSEENSSFRLRLRATESHFGNTFEHIEHIINDGVRVEPNGNGFERLKDILDLGLQAGGHQGIDPDCPTPDPSPEFDLTRTDEGRGLVDGREPSRLGQKPGRHAQRRVAIGCRPYAGPDAKANLLKGIARALESLPSDDPKRATSLWRFLSDAMVAVASIPEPPRPAKQPRKPPTIMDSKKSARKKGPS